MSMLDTESPSLLFDLELPDRPDDEEDEDVVKDFNACLESSMNVSPTVRQIRRIVQEAGLHPWRARGRDDTHDAGDERWSAESGRCAALARKLTSCGYEVTIRTGVRRPSAKQPNKDCSVFHVPHSFLVCQGQGITSGGKKKRKGGREAVIVDPSFAERFSVAHATPRFSRLLASLPETFVGTEQQLRDVLEFLTPEVALCFRELDMPCPPWRSVAALRAQWFPKHFHDEPADLQHAPSAPLPPLQQCSSCAADAAAPTLAPSVCSRCCSSCPSPTDVVGSPCRCSSWADEPAMAAPAPAPAAAAADTCIALHCVPMPHAVRQLGSSSSSADAGGLLRVMLQDPAQLPWPALTVAGLQVPPCQPLQEVWPCDAVLRRPIRSGLPTGWDPSCGQPVVV